MDSKRISFVAMLSALGIVLSAISLNIAPILNTMGQQGGAALDLSHIATFIAAFFGGPYLGAVVGFAGGIYAGYYFGYVLGSLGLLSVVGLPLGKALTGLVAGFLYKKSGFANSSRRSILAFPLTLLSYVPECVYTVFYFLYMVTLVSGQAMVFMIPIVIPKAWIEITVMSLLMSALAGNIGFREFINRFFYFQGPKKQVATSKA